MTWAFVNSFNRAFITEYVPRTILGSKDLATKERQKCGKERQKAI